MARSFEKDENDGDPQQVGAAAIANENCYVNAGEDDSDTIEEVPPSGDVAEDAAEGRHLYMDFFRTEIRRQGMEAELECLNRNPQLQAMNEIERISPEMVLDWTRAGQELRTLADAFSQSKERQILREKAQRVQLDSLDINNFFNLLQELFQNGSITRERILVLFFFCADVAIEALRQGFHRVFHKLVAWSLRYISTCVAHYVHSVGGWGVVLRTSLDIAYQFTACCAFVAVVAACVVYIRRTLN